MNKIELEEFKAYLDSRSYSACTKRAYIDGIKDYMEHGFTEVSTQLENNYVERLKIEGKKGRTVNLRISSLNAYNKWVGLPAIESVKINEDPFAINGMDLEDYFQLLENLLQDGKYHWYVIIKLLAGTGMRIGEASSVTYGDIRKGYCLVYGKGGKPRTIWFSHALRETLFMYIKDKPDDAKVIPYTGHYVRTALGQIKRRYKMTCNASPHEYRRLFARQMFESTNDMSLVKGLLGHESLSMTAHYAKKTQKQAMVMYARAQNW